VACLYGEGVLADAVRLLVCPYCEHGLDLVDGVVRCAVGHTFDVARQGYVNLLTGDAPLNVDTQAMVQERASFLDAGHFAVLADRIGFQAKKLLPTEVPGCVVDIGAGTGYYLARVLDLLPERIGVALDMSKYAARRAARAHSASGAVVTNAWDKLPVRSGGAALLLNGFAPRYGPELRRILHPRGALAVVTPTADHLTELVNAVGLLSVDTNKQERLTETLGAFFVRSQEERIEHRLLLGRTDVRALARMGPSAWHIDPAALEEKLEGLPESLDITASFTLSIYRPR
jgi:23S rRNA (guanine745-N1)-methyltransferase